MNELISNNTDGIVTAKSIGAVFKQTLAHTDINVAH
jgi:hypothetical protein